jgi:[acyl-carrier-protein] S-malonyltransferase
VSESTGGGPAFVFPGQGSQKVGMGAGWIDAYPIARETFAEADEVLGFALSTLCLDGPADQLQLTANTQPALLAASTAIHRAVAAEGVAPAMVAGHSLGEYSALVAAGALGFADALRLVRRRGEAMQAAVPPGEGAMAAVLGLDAAAVERVAAAAAAETGEVCAVANYNSPEQTVVAGTAAAVDRAAALATERGAKRAIRLPVSAPFHCALMAPAQAVMAELLAATEFRDPAVPVVVNVDARPVTTAAEARAALVRQVTAPVRWVESVRRMAADGAATFVEVGPGKVLTGLVRRIAPEATTAAVGELEDFRKFLAARAAEEGGA